MEPSSRKVPLVVLMGISGCGKSTVGSRLGDALGWKFIEGDEYHSKANIKRMSLGEPLADSDRQEWIAKIVHKLNMHEGTPCVLACSALSQCVRTWLREAKHHTCHWYWLDISKCDAEWRLARRSDHFMPATLVDSQLSALDKPQSATRLNATAPTESNCALILAELNQLGMVDGRISSIGSDPDD